MTSPDVGQLAAQRHGMKTYYVLRYRLDQIEAYLIWYSNDADGVVVDDLGNVPAFRDRARLQAYSAAHGLQVQDGEPALYDLDALNEWLARSGGTMPDPTQVLKAWNLMLDVAYAVRDARYVHAYRRAVTIYQKLALRSFLHATAGTNRHSEQLWTEHDRVVLSDILSAGLSLFRQRVRHA